MLRLIHISFILLSIISAQGQGIKLLNNLSSSEKRANILFDKFRYQEATPLFIKAFDKDTTRTDLAIKIGECYKLSNQYRKAEIWFQKGVTPDNNDPNSWMNYAQTLIINKKYDQAKEWLELYKKHKDDDHRAIKKLSTIDNLHSHFEDSSFIEFSRLNINTTYAEFSPEYYKDGIVFLSDRHSSDIHNAMDWNADEFVIIYFTNESEDGSMKEPVEFHKDLDSKYHEGPLTFHKDEIIFTRTGIPKKDSKEAHLELYSSTYNKKSKEWINVTPLPFNNEEYSVGHPTFSADGTKLIFSSNMPGGYGETDLYISERLNGSWSDPVNLGEIINSKGNEMFPYLRGNNELIFASDGHGGLGDLDLFKFNLTSTNPHDLENLGYPYNSSHADFGYISDPSGIKGFFTSNRLNGGHDDDIYQFSIKWARVNAEIVDERTKKPVINAKTELIIDDEVKDIQFTDSAGFVSFITFPKENISLKASQEDYFSKSYTVNLTKSDAGKTIETNISLKEKPKEAKKTTAEARYEELMEQYNKKKAMIQVDGRIFEYREIGNYQYLVNADEKILLSKDPPDPDQPIEERAKTAVEAKGLKMEESYELKNIFFDLDESSIPDKGKIELDKVIRIMTVDKQIAFEIVSYTDSRGSLAYNDELAFKRSQAVARYIIEHDIAGSRLILENYGEQGLLNDCDDTKECEEIYHAVNRRSELKLLLRKVYSESVE